MTIFKWLLLPATILAMVSFIAFITADVQRMKELRLIATVVFVGSCIMTCAAIVLWWRERKRSSSID